LVIYEGFSLHFADDNYLSDIKGGCRLAVIKLYLIKNVNGYGWRLPVFTGRETTSVMRILFCHETFASRAQQDLPILYGISWQSAGGALARPGSFAVIFRENYII
jgi:hypothetical protein